MFPALLNQIQGDPEVGLSLQCLPMKWEVEKIQMGIWKMSYLRETIFGNYLCRFITVYSR